MRTSRTIQTPASAPRMHSTIGKIYMSTFIADYRYILQELRDGETSSVWALECHPETKQLPFISKTGCMYIRFKRGISEEKAEEIRRLLNDCTENISVVD